jgi:hypothetical protein
VEIETGIVNGKFPKRALAHVIEWHGLYQEELMENWNLAQARKPLKKIQRKQMYRESFFYCSHAAAAET